MTVRIAIDCRPLRHPITGIGRYLYEILKVWASQDDDTEYYLYSPREIQLPDECRLNAKFHVRIKRFRPSTIWLHVVVPVWVVMDRIDIFWGPNYALPIVSFKRHRKVITIHDATFLRHPDTMSLKARLNTIVFQRVYATKSDAVLTVSEFSRRELRDALGMENGKISVTHLASFLNPGDASSVGSDNTNLILFVGTLEPRKNLQTLVQAYAEIPMPVRENHHLVVVGTPGWGNIDAESLFDFYGVTDTASYLGRITDEDLRNVYMRASVMVLPSLYEGFGLPVVEAMSLGVPVLCSYGSSLSEIGGNAPLYFDPTAPYELAAKLEIVLNDVSLRRKMSEIGRSRAVRFNWQTTAHETLDAVLGG